MSQMTRWTCREWLAWPLANPIMIPIFLIVIGFAIAAFFAKIRFAAVAVMIVIATIILASLIVYVMYAGDFPRPRPPF